MFFKETLNKLSSPGENREADGCVACRVMLAKMVFFVAISVSLIVL